ncbi:MAG: IS4 family transposase [Herpetosiphonaceae bacterium]|nr:IS4 family transposase [Herpetosiphonaceae bacterium]
MKMIEQVAAAMQDVLGRVAYQLGRETAFVQRESKLDGSRFVQTLVFTYLANPNASLTELTQTAAAVDLKITPAGLTQRFTAEAATLLQRVLGVSVKRVLAADQLAIPLLERFAGVYLEDSTTIVLPDALRDLWSGCGNATGQGRAALKISLRLDLCTGLLASLTLHDGRMHDIQASASLSALSKGSLYLADLGYFGLDRLHEISQHEAYFFSRLKASTQVFGPDGQRWRDLAAHLERQGSLVDLPVTLGETKRLPVRLLAVRVPQEVADQRRRKLRDAAQDKGRQVSARRLALAGWTIFLTNAPSEMVSLEAGMVLGRVRWQIELLFKLWKSHGHIDESRSTRPWRILCDIYAKLLAMLLQHWIALINLWGYPDRSLVKAARTVQKYAMQLITSLWSRERTAETLEVISRCVSAGCRMDRRKQQPSTFQLLIAVTQDGLA